GPRPRLPRLRESQVSDGRSRHRVPLRAARAHRDAPPIRHRMVRPCGPVRIRCEAARVPAGREPFRHRYSADRQRLHRTRRNADHHRHRRRGDPRLAGGARAPPDRRRPRARPHAAPHGRRRAQDRQHRIRRPRRARRRSRDARTRRAPLRTRSGDPPRAALLFQFRRRGHRTRPPRRTLPARVTAPTRETFASRFGTLMTIIGVAIGLGNVWRFPYMVGKFGGAAFVLFYAVISVAIGIPALMAEFALGRHTRRGPVGAFAAGGLPFGKQVGWFFFCIVIAASGYYSAVIGWVLFFA